MRNKTGPAMKVTFNYIEPKTKQENKEAQRRLDSAFDVLFEATPKKPNERKL